MKTLAELRSDRKRRTSMTKEIGTRGSTYPNLAMRSTTATRSEGERASRRRGSPWRRPSGSQAAQTSSERISEASRVGDEECRRDNEEWGMDSLGGGLFIQTDPM